MSLELINKRKNNNHNKQKVQLSIGVNFMNINDLYFLCKTRTYKSLVLSI